ncbi:MAG: hypothetical protein JSR17_10780 [Proteobacteria bacterium]|nr:hypothetical protein [Pseudomonadota bacterium]
MKKSLKVTFGTMLAVSMAAPIAAHALVHDAQHHVAVWGDLTYMRPSNNGLSVGDFAMPPFDQNFDGSRNAYFMEPENEFDYAVGLSFRLPNYKHTRVFFNYDHYQDDVDRQGDVNVRNLGLFPLVGPFQATFGTTELELTNHEFRVGAVHDLHFGDHFCLDLLAFFEYDKLRQELFETISQNNNNDLRTRQTENIAKGFGPGVGFVTRWYARNPHWQIFAGANTTLLAMDNYFKQTFVVLQGNNVGSGYDYEPTESDSLVGKLDLEFGLNYHCAFKHEMHGLKWDVSLGMRYMNMFNVLKNGNTAFQPEGGSVAGIAPNAQIGFATYLGSAQDWGKYGPFLRFKVGGGHS